MSGIFRWIVRRTRERLHTFRIGTVLLSVAALLLGSVKPPPTDPTLWQRATNGVFGFFFALLGVLALTFFLSSVCAPYEQRNALRKMVIASGSGPRLELLFGEGSDFGRRRVTKGALLTTENAEYQFGVRNNGNSAAQVVHVSLLAIVPIPSQFYGQLPYPVIRKRTNAIDPDGCTIGLGQTEWFTFLQVYGEDRSPCRLSNLVTDPGAWGVRLDGNEPLDLIYEITSTDTPRIEATFRLTHDGTLMVPQLLSVTS